MKNAKKLTAAVLAAAMAVAASGCGDQSWSYKTDNTSLSTGTYLYNMLNGFYEASDLVESPDEVKDILKVEVTGSDTDAETKTVEQYTYDSADEDTTRMIAIEELFLKYGLTLDDTEDEAARGYASQVWTTAKKTLEGYGISEESFTYCYADYNVKYGQVFEYHYGEKGDAYVDDDTLKSYFNDNYIGYAYFSASMADTDAEGNSVAKSDEEFAKTEDSFNSYAESINEGGKSYIDVAGEYAKDSELTYDPTYSGSVKKDDENTSLTAEVLDTLKNLDEGKASVVKTGEDATTMYYLVYKPKYSEIEDYLSTETNTATTKVGDIDINSLKSGYSRFTLINDMKGDDFKSFLKEYAGSLNIKKNETALKGYKPKMFVSKDSDSDK